MKVSISDLFVFPITLIACTFWASTNLPITIHRDCLHLKSSLINNHLYLQKPFLHAAQERYSTSTF